MARADELTRLFDVLAHPFRRVALYFLFEHGDASLETLAVCVTGWVRSGPGIDAGSVPDEHDAIRRDLHHKQLPRIADAGFGTYDAETRQMTLGDLPAVADEVLALAVAADSGDGRLDVDALVAAIEENSD